MADGSTILYSTATAEEGIEEENHHEGAEENQTYRVGGDLKKSD